MHGGPAKIGFAPSVRARGVTRGDAMFGAASFLALLALGYALLLLADIAAFSPAIAIGLTLTTWGGAHLAWRAFLRPAWHEIANRFAPEAFVPLTSPRVIDGDTIDDRATRMRYRLANIDAPETGDGARCRLEHQTGEDATSAAQALVAHAKTVTVRPTWRRDRFGRTVAFVYVDGQDLGELLIGARLAIRWRGKRKRWCGPRGGFAELAALNGRTFSCARCTRGRIVRFRRR